MATVSDLSFQSINEAAIADSSIGEAILSLSGDTIMLDIKKLTGDSFSALTDEGFCEAIFKLRKLAGEAQTAVNEATATTPSEELTSFPPFTYGIPSADGFVEVTQVQSVHLPLLTSTVIGTN